MRGYCNNFVCGAEADCTFECPGCQFENDCYYCNNQGCEHHGKSVDEIEWEDDYEE